MNNTPPTNINGSKRLEQRFEKLLWNSRLLVLLAVIPSAIGAFVLFLIGTADIVNIVIDATRYYFLQESLNIHDTVVPRIIMAVDIYLIAVVLLIFATGIYRLFVSPIDAAEQSPDLHPFSVQSFDQLKDKIARVVVLAVIIEFFRAVVDIRFQTPLDAIYLALSILALAGGLFLMNRANSGHH